MECQFCDGKHRVEGGEEREKRKEEREKREEIRVRDGEGGWGF